MQRMQAEQRSKAQAEAARIRERNMAVVQGRGRGESDDEEDEEQLKKTRAFDDWKARAEASCALACARTATLCRPRRS